MAHRPSYYEGLFPGPGTEMLVVSVSTLTGGGYPAIYLRWQEVQFTVYIQKAVGTWPMCDLLAQISGCKVIVDIDSENDTVAILAKQESSSPEASVQQKKLYGELGWPIRVPPKVVARPWKPAESRDGKECPSQ